MDVRPSILPSPIANSSSQDQRRLLELTAIERTVEKTKELLKASRAPSSVSGMTKSQNKSIKQYFKCTLFGKNNLSEDKVHLLQIFSWAMHVSRQDLHKEIAAKIYKDIRTSSELTTTLKDLPEALKKELARLLYLNECLEGIKLTIVLDVLPTFLFAPKTASQPAQFLPLFHSLLDELLIDFHHSSSYRLSGPKTLPISLLITSLHHKYSRYPGFNQLLASKVQELPSIFHTIYMHNCINIQESSELQTSPGLSYPTTPHYFEALRNGAAIASQTQTPTFRTPSPQWGPKHPRQFTPSPCATPLQYHSPISQRSPNAETSKRRRIESETNLAISYQNESAKEKEITRKIDLENARQESWRELEQLRATASEVDGFSERITDNLCNSATCVKGESPSGFFVLNATKLQDQTLHRMRLTVAEYPFPDKFWHFWSVLAKGSFIFDFMTDSELSFYSSYCPRNYSSLTFIEKDFSLTIDHIKEDYFANTRYDLYRVWNSFTNQEKFVKRIHIGHVSTPNKTQLAEIVGYMEYAHNFSDDLLLLCPSGMDVSALTASAYLLKQKITQKEQDLSDLHTIIASTVTELRKQRGQGFIRNQKQHRVLTEYLYDVITNATNSTEQAALTPIENAIYRIKYLIENHQLHCPKTRFVSCLEDFLKGQPNDLKWLEEMVSLSDDNAWHTYDFIGTVIQTIKDLFPEHMASLNAFITPWHRHFSSIYMPSKTFATVAELPEEPQPIESFPTSLTYRLANSCALITSLYPLAESDLWHQVARSPNLIAAFFKKSHSPYKVLNLLQVKNENEEFRLRVQHLRTVGFQSIYLVAIPDERILIEVKGVNLPGPSPEISSEWLEECIERLGQLPAGSEIFLGAFQHVHLLIAAMSIKKEVQMAFRPSDVVDHQLQQLKKIHPSLIYNPSDRSILIDFAAQQKHKMFVSSLQKDEVISKIEGITGYSLTSSEKIMLANDLKNQFTQPLSFNWLDRFIRSRPFFSQERNEILDGLSVIERLKSISFFQEEAERAIKKSLELKKIETTFHHISRLLAANPVFWLDPQLIISIQSDLAFSLQSRTDLSWSMDWVKQCKDKAISKEEFSALIDNIVFLAGDFPIFTRNLTMTAYSHNLNP